MTVLSNELIMEKAGKRDWADIKSEAFISMIDDLGIDAVPKIAEALREAFHEGTEYLEVLNAVETIDGKRYLFRYSVNLRLEEVPQDDEKLKEVARRTRIKEVT